jgi:hypothetical protein
VDLQSPFFQHINTRPVRVISFIKGKDGFLKTTYKFKGSPALVMLKMRVAANYENFKSEMLMLGEDEVFANARRIATVQAAFEQITGDGLDYVDKAEIDILLNFYGPLEMIADYMERSMDEGFPLDADGAITEIISDANAGDKYLTASFADYLAEKYGENTPMQISLLTETVEAGEWYLRLLKLTHKISTNESGDFTSPLKIMDFDEDGFFIYEDAEEVCF